MTLAQFGVTARNRGGCFMSQRVMTKNNGRNEIAVGLIQLFLAFLTQKTQTHAEVVGNFMEIQK